MPSTPLTDAIVALTTYANTITGESDATLSAAVESLVDGYGSGGFDINDLASGSISGSLEVTSAYIRDYFFRALNNVTSISCPNVTQLRDNIASNNTGLISISCPKATTVNGTMQFLGDTALKNVDLPILTVVANNMFQGCTSLEFIDLPEVTNINKSRLFYGCSSLKTIVLRYSSVVPVGGDSLTNTPFAGYNGLTGTCYVPNSLISSYQTASNWSTLYNNGTCVFTAIEGSDYE